MKNTLISMLKSMGGYVLIRLALEIMLGDPVNLAVLKMAIGESIGCALALECIRQIFSLKAGTVKGLSK
jgi:hypothetical protein